MNGLESLSKGTQSYQRKRQKNKTAQGIECPTLMSLTISSRKNYSVSAECISNCDETGWSGKESSREKVIRMRRKHTYQQQMFTSDHIYNSPSLCFSCGTFPAYNGDF